MNTLCPWAGGLCLLAAGCAGPLDQPWEPPAERPGPDRPHAQAPPDAFAFPTDPLDALDALSVEDAIRIAIAHNPRLEAAGYRVEFAAGRETQAGLYPNPSFEFGAEGLGSEAGEGGETIYRVEQEVVLGGRLRLARRVAEADHRIAEAELAAEEFAVARRVTTAYFAAVAARERLTLRQDLLDLSGRLLEAAAARVDAGDAIEPDRLRAQVAAEQAGIELDTARLDADSALRTLASAVGSERRLTLALSSDIARLPELPGEADIATAAVDANGRMDAARIAIERARRAHELARAEAVPDLVASVGPRYSDPDDETTLDVGLGIEIPLFDRNQGEIRAALAGRLSAAADLRAVQLELLDEVARAWSAYEGARIASTRYRDNLLPSADRTLELTRTAYERGQVDYLRLLDAQQVVVESRIAYFAALERLHEAAALLNELAQTDAAWRRPLNEEVNP